MAINDFSQTPGEGKERGKVPTMLRGYLKIGARVSEHAIIDPVFNTTFVAIYVDANEMFGTNHALVNKSVVNIDTVELSYRMTIKKNYLLGVVRIIVLALWIICVPYFLCWCDFCVCRASTNYRIYFMPELVEYWG